MKDDKGLSAGIAAAACIAVTAACAALAVLGVVREALPDPDLRSTGAQVALAALPPAKPIVVRTEPRTRAAGLAPARTAGAGTNRPRTAARRPRPQAPPPGPAAAPDPVPAAEPLAPAPAVTPAADDRRGPLRSLARSVAWTTRTAGRAVGRHDRPVGQLVEQAGETVARTIDGIAVPPLR